MNTHAAYELDAILERYELALTAKAAPAVLPGIRRKAEQAIEKASASAFRALSRRINMTGLRGALRDGDIDEAVSNVPIAEVLAQQFKSKVNGVVRETFIAAGNRSVQQLRQKLVRKDVSFSVRANEFEFDVLETRGLEALRKHGASLVTEISDSTEIALRELLSVMLEEGVPVTSQVGRIQDVVGLHSRHVRAVENLRLRLEALGKSPKLIDRRVASKARELHRLRAQSIARFESGWAAGAGQQEAWQQAFDEDLLTETARRVWRTAGDELVRDEHVEMNGERVEMDQAFVLPDGEPIDFPPTDPGCRCSVDLDP